MGAASSCHPLVSVLMPVYNEEDNVVRAIKSVIAQTYRNWEFVIVDDGSTDRTPTILKEFSESDPRIKVIRNERNMGITASLNRGLKACKGEYIARLDADDWYHPEKLEEQVRFLEEHPDHGMVGTFFTLVYDDGREIRVSLPVKHENILKRMAYRNSFCHSCVTFRREVLEVAGYYDEKLKYAQDYDLYFRVMSIAKAANIPKYLCYRRYRKHSKRRMVRSTLNSIIIPFKYWRVLGVNTIYYVFITRRILTLLKILLFY